VNFIIIHMLVYGQDSLSIAEIVVSAQRMRLGITDSALQVNQINGVNDLVSNIALLGGGAYRNNGTALSTIAIRGGSTSQTTVLWNNLQIQSPMLGLLDYSLLPMGNYDVNLLAGDAAMWGSGAVAGIISMSSPTSHKKGLHGSIDLLRGSFGAKQYIPKIYFSNKRFSISHTTDLLKQENNYPYALGNGSFDTLFNASVDIKNFQTDLKFKLTSNAQLSVHHWYQAAHRQLPPTAGSIFGIGEQGDTSNRIKINFDLTHRALHFNLGVGHFDEANVYSSSLSWSYGDNRFKSWIADASVNYSRRHFKFLIGANFIDTKASAINYKEARTDNRLAVFYSAVYNYKGWQLNHKLRFENNIQTSSLPILPAFNLSKSFGNWKAMVSINKVFRQPTLNDRYWSPGGNSALLAESGWAREANLSYRLQHNERQSSSIKVNAYSRTISNWIQWGRAENNPYFTALNLTEVVSQGLELLLNHKVTLGQVQYNQSARYDYTLATNQKEVLSPMFAKGEQLWYIPKHQLYLNSDLKYRACHLWLNYKYSSLANGINTDIPAYNIYNAGLDYELALNSNVNIIAGLGIFNLANEDYVLTEGRPMKRRNTNIFFKIKF
jgi:vitamin B12 transporter